MGAVPISSLTPEQRARLETPEPSVVSTAVSRLKEALDEYATEKIRNAVLTAPEVEQAKRFLLWAAIVTGGLLTYVLIRRK